MDIDRHTCIFMHSLLILLFKLWHVMLIFLNFQNYHNSICFDWSMSKLYKIIQCMLHQKNHRYPYYMFTRLFAHTWGYKLNISSSIAFLLCCTCLTCCTQGFLKGFCDIAKVVIIHIIIYPNFSLYLHESSKKTKSFYFFGSLLELNHKNW